MERLNISHLITDEITFVNDFCIQDYFSHCLNNKSYCIPLCMTFIVPRRNAQKKKKNEIISSLQLQRHTLHKFIPLHSDLLFEWQRTEGKTTEQEVSHRDLMLVAEKELVATQLLPAQKYSHLPLH